MLKSGLEGGGKRHKLFRLDILKSRSFGNAHPTTRLDRISRLRYGVLGGFKSNSSKELCQFPQATAANVEESLIYGANSKGAFLSASEILLKRIKGRFQT